MKARHLKPNKLEKKLEKRLQRLFPNQWKYVGNGELVIGGRCPDYVNIDGKKRLIELFGDYWHVKDNPQDRIDHFKKYGFDTFIIWEKEMKDWKNLKAKLLMEMK